MIIVSQDREWMFNFDNTTSIGIDEENTLKVISIAGKWNILGKYKTKDRAKEILEEIVRAKTNKLMITYKNYKPIREQISRAKLIKNMQEDIGVISVDEEAKIESLPDCAIYYMPEE